MESSIRPNTGIAREHLPLIALAACGADNPNRSYSYSLDADITLSAFLTGCIESPQLCALASIYSSAGILSRRIARLLEDLKVSPLALGPNRTTDVVTYGRIKSTIVSALYFPFSWSGLAELLAAVIEGNASAYASATVPGYSPPSLFPNLAGLEVQNGIQCADKPFRSDDLAGMAPVLARFEAESWIRGDGDIAIQALQCARWKFTSKERYEGTFDNIETRYPALVVGNSIDPTTPLASARNLSEGLKGSVLLQNNGYGVSLHQPYSSTRQPDLTFFTAAHYYRLAIVVHCKAYPRVLCQRGSAACGNCL